MNKILFFVVLFLFFLSGCSNIPVCGNEICEQGESVDSCAVDCSLKKQSCSAIQGFECQENEICPGTKINTFDLVLCCSEKCEIQQIAEQVAHGCNVDLDCDDGDEKTIDVCKGFPRNCSNSIKTCAEINGEVCDVNSFCGNGLIESADEENCCISGCNKKSICEILTCPENEKCVNDKCILKTCEEQGGVSCTRPQICIAGNSILSFNVSACCASDFCVTSFSCSGDDGICTEGCPGGDSDCSCDVLGGVLVDGLECAATDYIFSADDKIGSTCCANPIVSTSCEDTDGGNNPDQSGFCIVTGIKENGDNIIIESLGDICDNNTLRESYCESLGDNSIGNLKHGCKFNPTFCNSCGDGICFDQEGEFAEGSFSLKEGESLTGLAGKNSLERQDVSIKLLSTITSPYGSVYAGTFSLLSSSGSEIQSSGQVNDFQYLTDKLKDTAGVDLLKTIILVESYSINATTGLGEVDLKILYVK